MPYKQFAKTYASDGVTNQHFLLELKDRSLIVGGQLNNKLLLLKTDFDGTTIWSKTYAAVGSQNQRPFTKAVADTDGSLICAFDNSYLAKVDTDGNVITTRKLTNSNGDLRFLDLAVTSDGDKIVFLHDGNTYKDNYLLVRISADLSRIVWTEYFTATEAYFKDILLDNDRILLVGTVSYAMNVVCFSSASGALIKQSSFRVANRKNTTNNIYKYQGGYIVHGYLFQELSDIPEDNNVIVRLTSDLTPLRAFFFVNINRQTNLTLTTETNGSFYGAFGWNSNSLMYINQNDSVIWSRRNYAIPASTPIHMLKSTNSLIVSGGDVRFDTASNRYTWYYSLIKSDLDGTLKNCTYEDNPVKTMPLSFTKESYSVSARSSSVISLRSDDSRLENIQIAEETKCVVPGDCSRLEIIGPATICDSGTVTYIGRRNQDCTLPLKWTVRGEAVVKQDVNDSTIEVRFLKSGIYSIQANLIGKCDIVNDSTQVKVMSSALQTFTLGPDTALCANTTLVLNARNGYSSYLWQDGSTDSTFKVTQPGTYHISVKDSCGNDLKDAITVRINVCNQEFYIPNSFTPNGDGRNDVFRPLLSNVAINYRFTVYNRWGEKVFETTEIGKGWNGNTRGEHDVTSTYIWTCSYQFAGTRPKNEKGTVVLIR